MMKFARLAFVIKIERRQQGIARVTVKKSLNECGSGEKITGKKPGNSLANTATER